MRSLGENVKERAVLFVLLASKSLAKNLKKNVSKKAKKVIVTLLKENVEIA
jgi:hypothetical protein